jgi:hypothetical protein
MTPMRCNINHPNSEDGGSEARTDRFEPSIREENDGILA